MAAISEVVTFVGNLEQTVSGGSYGLYFARRVDAEQARESSLEQCLDLLEKGGGMRIESRLRGSTPQLEIRAHSGSSYVPPERVLLLDPRVHRWVAANDPISVKYHLVVPTDANAERDLRQLVSLFPPDAAHVMLSALAQPSTELRLRDVERALTPRWWTFMSHAAAVVVGLALSATAAVWIVQGRPTAPSEALDAQTAGPRPSLPVESAASAEAATDWHDVETALGDLQFALERSSDAVHSKLYDVHFKLVPVKLDRTTFWGLLRLWAHSRGLKVAPSQGTKADEVVAALLTGELQASPADRRALAALSCQALGTSFIGAKPAERFGFVDPVCSDLDLAPVVAWLENLERGIVVSAQPVTSASAPLVAGSAGPREGPPSRLAGARNGATGVQAGRGAGPLPRGPSSVGPRPGGAAKP